MATYVLVHGSYQGGWIWQKVADRLRGARPGEDAETRLFADLAPATRAWALDRYTQHPAGIYTEGVKLDSFWSQKWRADVIWCRRAQNPGEAHQRRAADKLGGKWHELDTGHYPMLSMPEELSRILLAG